MDELRTQQDVARLAELRQQHIGRLLQRAARAFSVRAAELLHARGYHGLSLAHTTLLSYLDLEGTWVTVLAERAGMTKQSMGQLVKELEQQGYVSRRPDPSDQRAALVTFTEAGWRFLADASAIKQEIEAEYAAILGTQSLADLRRALRLLIDDAEASDLSLAADEAGHD
jgi:DNA-binding MarR family transcriptional regulator